MAKEYRLEIMTPEYSFYDGLVESIIVKAPDGEMAILADHAPLVSPIFIGSIKIKINGQWKEAFNSEGFMEINKKEVIIFVQACEWPEDIDRNRAEESRIRAEERLRQRQSINENKSTQIALVRAMARLRISNQKSSID